MKTNSCTPIYLKEYSCYGLKKIHTRNLITKKIPAARKFPTPFSSITFLMVRLLVSTCLLYVMGFKLLYSVYEYAKDPCVLKENQRSYAPTGVMRLDDDMNMLIIFSHCNYVFDMFVIFLYINAVNM